MTRIRSLLRVLGAAACLAPAALRAQPVQPGQPLQPSTDETLLARADSITVGDYCKVARATLASPTVIATLGADTADARAQTAIICDPLLASFSLRALAGRAPAPLAAVARVRTNGYSEARHGIFDAMSDLRATLRAPGVRVPILRAIGPADSAMLVRASETAQGLLSGVARDAALARLARYERKLGPTSAKLNGLEVLLNYGAQWIPVFRPSPLKGPSPWEIVASYTPAYVTSVGGRVQPVSASEFGLRHYLFGEAFGAPGPRGIVLPTYWSAGVLTTSDRNGALVWPWEGKTRTGAYVSWGATKVGYIPGRHGAFLMSKQFQAVPFVF